MVVALNCGSPGFLLNKTVLTEIQKCAWSSTTIGAYNPWWPIKPSFSGKLALNKRLGSWQLSPCHAPGPGFFFHPALFILLLPLQWPDVLLCARMPSQYDLLAQRHWLSPTTTFFQRVCPNTFRWDFKFFRFHSAHMHQSVTRLWAQLS